MTIEPHDAFGWPGISPTFSAGDKDAVTTALGTTRVWATIGGGILNEVFWPNTGRPQLRDLGFLVSGEDFWTEVKRLATYTVTTPAPSVPLVTVTHTHERYTLALEFLCDSRRDVVVVRYQLTNLAPASGPLQLHILAAPHLGGNGHNNNGYVLDGALAADRDSEALAVINDGGFTLSSVGFVSASDGWQDSNTHGRPTFTFTRALNGNIALTGTCSETQGTLAIGFANTIPGAVSLAKASLAEGFDDLAATFTSAWTNWCAAAHLPDGDQPLDRLAHVSLMVLKIHEDVTYPGAIVASLATPWGAAHDDPGGYHLVWPRDCAETGLALAAASLYDDARRMVQFLISVQSPDGHWPQNFTPDGAAYWSGIQLDETALPVILALKLHELGQLDLPAHSHTTAMIRRAVRYLADNAPFTQQDRWEETAGISPFTLAATIAALAGAAISGCLETAVAEAALSLADTWNGRIEDYLYVAGTDLDHQQGTTGHYARIAPRGTVAAHTRVTIANRAGETFDSAELLGLEFLALVRYGLRSPTDPRIVDTVKLIDAVLASSVPQGTLYHRYQDDGYGEHEDGTPFDGSGVGRLWPLLAGERGHYALSAGVDPTPYLAAMAASVSAGGLLPEQIWDAPDIPERRLFTGRPTGSATPLVWAHAEYLKLYLAHRRGINADQLSAVAQRYCAPTSPVVAHKVP